MKKWDRQGLLLCSDCHRDVTNGHANIMVKSGPFFDKRYISGLRVVCKPCSRKIPIADEHNLWELYTVRDSPWSYMGEVLREAMHRNEFDDRWEPESVDAFVDILIELLPEDAASGLLQYCFAPTEWDREGPRSERFRKHRSMEPEDRPEPVPPV